MKERRRVGDVNVRFRSRRSFPFPTLGGRPERPHCVSMQLEITVSYAQLCVFDPALEAPYNDWAEGHVVQGFSWRSRSVSFATDSDCTLATVNVTQAQAPPDFSGAESVIRVPFAVPPSGTVEIGSVMSGQEIAIPPGHYALFFLAPSDQALPFRLAFVPMGDAEPAVLKEGRNAKVPQSYLMMAEPA